MAANQWAIKRTTQPIWSGKRVSGLEGWDMVRR